MNIGDRVITPDGPGELVHKMETPDSLTPTYRRGRWYFWVRLDGKTDPAPKYYPAAKVRPE